MVDRGLMVVHAGSPHMARACFTDAGLPLCDSWRRSAAAWIRCSLRIFGESWN
jgi:hypothetical protein